MAFGYQVLGFGSAPAAGAAAAFYGGRALIAGGYTGAPFGDIYQDDIDYFAIASAGNAADFGDLTVDRTMGGQCSNGTRGVFGGGLFASPHAQYDTIDYVTVASIGNAIDFGDLLFNSRDMGFCCSNGLRGCWAGGYYDTGSFGSTDNKRIDYVTLATTGNAADFGDLTANRRDGTGISNATRGVFCGGYISPAYQNIMEYITIATLGDATDFGNLTVARGNLGSCMDTTRGVMAGGSGPYNNVIDYITIASLGDATDFGDLTLPRGSGVGGVSNGTRGVFCGGYSTTAVGAPANAVVNIMDYITIQSLGNASDFGDLIIQKSNLGGCSGD